MSSRRSRLGLLLSAHLALIGALSSQRTSMNPIDSRVVAGGEKASPGGDSPRPPEPRKPQPPRDRPKETRPAPNRNPTDDAWLGQFID